LIVASDTHRRKNTTTTGPSSGERQTPPPPYTTHLPRTDRHGRRQARFQARAPPGDAHEPAPARARPGPRREEPGLGRDGGDGEHLLRRRRDAHETAGRAGPGPLARPAAAQALPPLRPLGGVLPRVRAR